MECFQKKGSFLWHPTLACLMAIVYLCMSGGCSSFLTFGTIQINKQRQANEQSAYHCRPPGGAWRLDGEIGEPDRACLRRAGRPAMGFHRRQMSGGLLLFRLVFHARVRGGSCSWRGQFLRRMDEKPHECDDQLQRRFPPLLLLHRGDGRVGHWRSNISFFNGFVISDFFIYFCMRIKVQ